MAAYRRVYDSRHLQADCKEPGSAPEPYARYSSMGYLSRLYSRGCTTIFSYLTSYGKLFLNWKTTLDWGSRSDRPRYHAHAC